MSNPKQYMSNKVAVIDKWISGEKESKIDNTTNKQTNKQKIIRKNAKRGRWNGSVRNNNNIRVT